MATYLWKGNAAQGPTGFEWGYTANWLSTGAVSATLPAGGDLVIFGASAEASCLFGGFVNGLWQGYSLTGNTFHTGAIHVRIDPRFGVTLPNNATQIGFSFGFATGPMQLNCQYLYVGTTAGASGRTAEIGIRNIPSVAAYAHMDGPTATLFTEGTWSNISVERGNLETRGLTANLISIQGVKATGPSYNPLTSTDGFGVGKINIGGESNINAVIVNAKATSQQVVINTVPRYTTINAMGITGTGHTFTTIQQNFRPAGLERSFNEINKTLKYRRD